MPDDWTSRLSVSEICTFRWSFEEDVLRYRQAGYGAIGVWRAKVSDYGQRRARAILSESELEVASLHWVGGFTGSDGRSYRDALIDGFDAIELAASINASTVVLLSGSLAGHTPSHARKNVQFALRELSEAAMARGVNVAIEPMHVGCAENFTFLTDLTQTLDLIVDIDRPNLGLVFDCYHMSTDPEIIENADQIVSLTKLVQIGDAKTAPFGEQNRCLLGDGMLPLQELISIFEKGGYRGYYEVELIGEDVEHVDYETLLHDSIDRFENDLAPR